MLYKPGQPLGANLNANLITKMSASSSLKPGELRNKRKPFHYNSNSMFQNKDSHSKKDGGHRSYGPANQSKSQISRRAPAPILLPSLKSQTGNNDPNVNLVPPGGPGWGTSSCVIACTVSDTTQRNAGESLAKPREQFQPWSSKADPMAPTYLGGRDLVHGTETSSVRSRKAELGLSRNKSEIRVNSPSKSEPSLQDSEVNFYCDDKIEKDDASESALKSELDEITKDDMIASGWALAHNDELDYSAKIVFSDDDEDDEKYQTEKVFKTGFNVNEDESSHNSKVSYPEESSSHQPFSMPDFTQPPPHIALGEEQGQVDYVTDSVALLEALDVANAISLSGETFEECKCLLQQSEDNMMKSALETKTRAKSQAVLRARRRKKENRLRYNECSKSEITADSQQNADENKSPIASDNICSDEVDDQYLDRPGVAIKRLANLEAMLNLRRRAGSDKQNLAKMKGDTNQDQESTNISQIRRSECEEQPCGSTFFQSSDQSERRDKMFDNPMHQSCLKAKPGWNDTNQEIKEQDGEADDLLTHRSNEIQSTHEAIIGQNTSCPSIRKPDPIGTPASRAVAQTQTLKFSSTSAANIKKINTSMIPTEAKAINDSSSVDGSKVETDESIVIVSELSSGPSHHLSTSSVKPHDLEQGNRLPDYGGSQVKQYSSIHGASTSVGSNFLKTGSVSPTNVYSISYVASLQCKQQSTFSCNIDKDQQKFAQVASLWNTDGTYSSEVSEKPFFSDHCHKPGMAQSSGKIPLTEDEQPANPYSSLCTRSIIASCPQNSSGIPTESFVQSSLVANSYSTDCSVKYCQSPSPYGQPTLQYCNLTKTCHPISSQAPQGLATGFSNAQQINSVHPTSVLPSGGALLDHPSNFFAAANAIDPGQPQLFSQAIGQTQNPQTAIYGSVPPTLQSHSLAASSSNSNTNFYSVNQGLLNHTGQSQSTHPSHYSVRQGMQGQAHNMRPFDISAPERVVQVNQSLPSYTGFQQAPGSRHTTQMVGGFFLGDHSSGGSMRPSSAYEAPKNAVGHSSALNSNCAGSFSKVVTTMHPVIGGSSGQKNEVDSMSLDKQYNQPDRMQEQHSAGMQRSKASSGAPRSYPNNCSSSQNQKVINRQQVQQESQFKPHQRRPPPAI